MKEEQKRLKTRLTIIYWCNMLFSLSLSIFLLFEVGINGKSVTEQDFVWERFGIILAIVVIPLSLKLFHQSYKKIISDEMSLFLKKVQKYYLARLVAIDSIIIFNLVGFYFVGALNFLYMALISIFVLLVCYPTEEMIDPV